MKRALITGITGQDGSYLAELLLEKGYSVYGIIRRHSVVEGQFSRLEECGIRDRVNLLYGDVTDFSSICHIIQDLEPDEIYNLAAQSHVRISFDQPVYTTNVDAIGALNIFEAVRLHSPGSKVYQAGSSEMFGNIDVSSINEETPMDPVSPYGCAKLFAHMTAKCYRSSYNLFIVNGILFNHESPRRGLNFVTNKIVAGAVDIYKGLDTKLELGNLDSYRDWGHAKDYVRAMWMMLQQNIPTDYVCATGETRSVREFCEEVFNQLNLDYKDFVVINPKYYRPTELNVLVGDSSRLRNHLGWKPEYTFESMVKEMIEARF